MSWPHALAVWLACALSAVGATTSAADAVRLVGPVHDERSLASGAIQFQRGVFRVAPDSGEVVLLCLPVNGVWRQVGTQKDCGKPPPELQREAARYPENATFLVVRNLGVDREQWEAARDPAKVASIPLALRKVGDAFSYTVGERDVSWHLDSRKLPLELRTQIPGSGIHVHFGGQFAAGEMPKVVSEPLGGLEVEVGLSIPKSVRSGKAHSGVTLAVMLNMQSTRGEPVSLAVIASLFNRRQSVRENVRSDGRVLFAQTYLGEGTRYVRAVENRQRSDPWRGTERFALAMEAGNLRAIVTETNLKRVGEGLVPIDESRLTDARVSSVTVRNESRFLDEGYVDIEVRVDYLRVLRLAGGR